MSAAIKSTAAAAALATMLWSGLALPCGAPFSSDGPMVTAPDQEVIVAHRSGVETYVFQPTVCGDAKEFGLVIPVAAPLAEAPSIGDPGAFAVLDYLSRPRHVAVEQCRSRGVGGSMDASAPGADAGGEGGSDVSIVASGRVGFLDWTELEVKDATSFTAWLDANGYAHDARSQQIFEYYVGQQGYFVAFKIAQDASFVPGRCTALGPITLRFPTATPIVPTLMATAAQPPPVGDAGPPSHSIHRWLVYGITDDGGQIADVFGNVTFSGLIGPNDRAHLEALAQVGDRLTKFTLTFDGSRRADEPLQRMPGVDAHETIYDVTYVDCAVGGGGDGLAGLGGSGCALATSSGAGGWWCFGAASGLALALRARRRR